MIFPFVFDKNTKEEASHGQIHCDYQNILQAAHPSHAHLHRDCTYLVNATPVGMYPDTDVMPLEPGRLPGCLGVLDLIYNPPVTKLMRRADALNIPSFNGLYMLVAQAKKSSELFTGSEIPDSRIREIYLQMNTPE